MEATYDGFNYLVNDSGFQYHINAGISDPYPNHIKAVKNYLALFPHKNRTYIDIGAHIGTTILPYSRLFQNVIAFEANPENFRYLLLNIKRNDVTNCTVHQCAVTDDNSQGNIVKHGANSGCFLFVKDPTGTISSIKLDSLDGLDNIDFIKIDTEGSELLVLHGATNLIAKWKPLIHIESNGLSDTYYHITHNQIVDFLTSRGYVLFQQTDPTNYFFYFPE
jgi:FkbM family methyltransferase